VYESFGVDVFGSVRALFVCSTPICGALGSVFRNLGLRDSTEIENPKAANTQKFAIKKGRDLAFLSLVTLRL